MPNRKTPTNSSYQAGPYVALTARTFFSAASNTTGIKIHCGSALENQNAAGFGHFVIATSAPATMADGLIVSEITALSNSATNGATYKIKEDTFAPAGYGLYWISTAAFTVGATEASWSAA